MNETPHSITCRASSPNLLKPNTTVLSDDYDSPWKEVLERYFPAFLAFFFPVAHADIAWEHGYRFLDKELQKVVRDAQLGRRWADKLVQVTTLDGSEDWLLVPVTPPN